MMNRILLIIFFIAGYCLSFGQKSESPGRLRCDYLLNTDKVNIHGLPVKQSMENAVNQKKKYEFVQIISPAPAFNWELGSFAAQSSAYRILVASSKSLINADKGDLWDSKKIRSLKTGAEYAGKKLVPGSVVYWKVQVWNETGLPSSFSETASFYYGLPDISGQFSHYPLTAKMQEPVTFERQGNNGYFFDFGKDGFAQLFLHLTSEKNDSIWIEAAEALESPGRMSKVDRNIRYIRLGLFVKKGTHDYTIEWPVNEKRNSRNPIMMPDYIGEVFPFRYVSVQNFSGLINKHSISRKVVSYPFDENASYFHSSDTVLNQVWDLCKYSIKATSFSGFYVDGDRERLPYEADALINQLSHYAVDAEYSMARRSMAFLLFHPTWPTEWSLQNISLAWNDYLYTGNDSYLKYYYYELQKKVLMPLAAENGLISTQTNKQTDEFLTSIHITKIFDGKRGLVDNVDWPQKGTFIGDEKEYPGETDGFVYCIYNSVINAWYYHSLTLMKSIATVLNKPADAVLYDEKARQVYQSFQKIFRDEKTRLVRDGDTTNHTSLHANMFALAFGLVAEKDVSAVTNFIKTRKMACSVYGAQFLLEGLYEAGQAGYALDLMTSTSQRSWYNMIRVGSTITMEAWDKVYKPNLDLNHAWGAAPANIIVRKLMGIEPVTAGFETFRIKPQIGRLTFAELKTTTIKGEIFVSWKRLNGQDRVELVIPGGTSAEVILPSEAGKSKLTINGTKSRVKPEAGFFIIKDLPAGKYLVTLSEDE